MGSYEHSSLLRRGIKYGRKKFYSFSPRRNLPIKTTKSKSRRLLDTPQSLSELISNAILHLKTHKKAALVRFFKATLRVIYT